MKFIAYWAISVFSIWLLLVLVEPRFVNPYGESWDGAGRFMTLLISCIIALGASLHDDDEDRNRGYPNIKD